MASRRGGEGEESAEGVRRRHQGAPERPRRRPQSGHLRVRHVPGGGGLLKDVRHVPTRSVRVALAPHGTATAQEAQAPSQAGAAPRGYPMGEPAVQLCTAQVQAVQHLLTHRHRARAGVHLHRGGADDGVQLVYAVRRGRVPTQLPIRNRPGDDG